jgi:tetraacyldisaccharide 4'-kinase
MSWGNPSNNKEKALAALLWPAATAYGVGAFSRLMAYNTGLLRRSRLAVPVISVGNITVGGTGKTPVTIDLARRLHIAGHKVGILSRGYKRKSNEKRIIVSNGENLLTSSFECGDEPYMMAQALPRCVVIAGANRAENAQIAMNKFGCTALILDDGFQHFGIMRGEDVALIDYNDELENDHLLPAGRLREPLAGLVRANWVVVTKVPEQTDQEKLDRIRAMIGKQAPDAQITSCRIKPAAVQAYGSDVQMPADTLEGAKVFAFCGIARPEPFFASLRALGADIVGQSVFGDHHWFTPREIDDLRNAMEERDAEMLITTEKDAVRVIPELLQNVTLGVLKQKVEWLGPVPVLNTQPWETTPQLVGLRT